MSLRLRFIRHYTIFLFVMVLFSLGSCKPEGDRNEQEEQKIKEVNTDLAAIKERGSLKAITFYGSTSYFLYRGRPMGYEYELVSRMAEDMGLNLEIVIAEDLNKEIEMLKQGKGDIIIHGLTITQDRKKRITFTEPHTTTHQVLIQKKPDNWRQMKIHEIRKKIVSDPVELIGKKVYVRKNSSYYARLQNLEEELGGDIDIVTVPGDLTTEDLIKKVADGDIPYTVADYNIAAINKTYYQDLDIDVRLSFSQRIAWAVRESSPELLSEVNEWIGRMKQNTDYYVIYNKYFNNIKSYRRRVKSDFFSLESGKISRYDDLIKTYAGPIDWDWRLLSSMIYQESRFNPKTKSWAGARGLMQLMPATAREMGINNPYSPEPSIKGGTKYLAHLKEQWTSIADSSEKVKFILASYNAGLSHVRDAQRLASKHDKDHTDWQVIGDYLVKLSKPEYYNDPVVQYGYVRGEEPFYYVKEILARYEHYKRFVE